MKELKIIKNLLLDALADEGGENIKIGAIQSLKIDEAVGVPIIINQHMNISVGVRRNIVKAIQTIDDVSLIPIKNAPEKDGLYLEMVKEIVSEGSLAAVVDNIIFRTVAKCGGNKTKAAELLGMSRRTVRYKTKKKPEQTPELTE